MKRMVIVGMSVLSGAVLTVSALLLVMMVSEFYTSGKQELARLKRNANTEQLALIEAASQYEIRPTLLLAISKIETGGTFSTSIRPRRRNGKFIGTARGLCQFIKVIAKAYQLDWATDDADKQAVACARLLKDNEAYLARKLNRKPSGGEIYLSHVFGAGKAIRIIQAKADLSVVRTVGKRALNANRFLARYKNAAGIRKWAERKISKAQDSFI